jgi:hypothetical protein
MTTSQSIYFLIFGCLLYLIFTDENIAKLVGYLGRLARFQYDKAKWLLLHSPSNPVVKYMIYRRSLKTAERLLKKIKDKE